MPKKLTQEQVICRSISEDSILQAVTDLAVALGAKVYHFRDSRRGIGDGMFVGDAGAKGYPDLTIILPWGVWWIECKKELGKVRPEQQECLDAINRAMPGHALVARPSNWRNGEIEQILKGE